MSLKLLVALFAFASSAFLIAATGQTATAAPCGESSVRGNLQGENDRVRLSLGGYSKNCAKASQARTGSPQPFYSHEISCSSDRQAAADGICSTTPCPGAGQFFAFRTIHRPDGSSGPAGFSCVTLDQAVATPGVTVAQVFEAIRKVKLPGGEIGVEPEVRGLANLESYFWIEGRTSLPSNSWWADRRCGRSSGWSSTCGHSGADKGW